MTFGFASSAQLSPHHACWPAFVWQEPGSFDSINHAKKRTATTSGTRLSTNSDHGVRLPGKTSTTFAGTSRAPSLLSVTRRSQSRSGVIPRRRAQRHRARQLRAALQAGLEHARRRCRLTPRLRVPRGVRGDPFVRTRRRQGTFPNTASNLLRRNLCSPARIRPWRSTPGQSAKDRSMALWS